jgi:acyl-CoA synthetase (AMP-forming)/AMP-acid ligase II
VCGITGRCYTYRDVVRLVRAYSYHLVREGLQKGQVLAIVLPNLPEYPIAFLGALSAGLSVCPVSHMYKSGNILPSCRKIEILKFRIVDPN